MSLKLFKSFIICASCIFFIGCTTTSYKAPSYWDHQSKAFNIAKAGHLNEGVRDTSVPKNIDSGIVGTAWDATDLYVTYFSNPSLGLTSMGSLGLGLLAKAAGPEEEWERNGFIAWMPKTHQGMTFEEAKNEMDRIVIESSVIALKSFNIKAVYFGKSDKGEEVYTLVSDEYGCQAIGESSSCTLKFHMRVPQWEGESPDYLFSPTFDSIVFTSLNDIKKSSWIEINSPKTARLPQKDIYTAISKELPEWAFIYLAPKKVKFEDGQVIPFPFMLNNGKPEFFVYPDKV